MSSSAVSVVSAALAGQLDRTQLEARLAAATPRGSGLFGLVLDCTAMTGYELDARHAFVAWSNAQRARLVGIAIVTANPVWRMVITAMSLASGVEMRAFEARAGATTWVSSLASARSTRP